ncbi:MAG: hypothetical protein QF681_18135, partial [Vicinamibacterales bacterium]|nr:hypothetical protein [Vicinamibacterales bacterium]
LKRARSTSYVKLRSLNVCPRNRVRYIAAIITPTADVGNLLIIAGPMVLLYGVGIVIAWLFGRPRQAEEAES